MALIREATTADRDDVVRLWMSLLRSQAVIDERYTPADDAEVRWRNDFTEWLKRSSRRLFVAEVDGQVHGFITAERWTSIPVYRVSSEVYIGELFVEPSHRRKGIGRALVQAARDWADSIGAQRIRAGILARNDDGFAFWRAAGGEDIAVTIGIELQEAGQPDDAAESGRARLGF